MDNLIISYIVLETVEETVNSDMIAVYLTFFVGLLGVISQITINYFSEKNKYKMTIIEIKNNNIVNFYIPLLNLLKQYQFYRKILVKDNKFDILIKFYNVEKMDKSLNELKKIINEIGVLMQKKYIPTDEQVNKKILEFEDYILTLQYIFESNLSKEIIKEIFGSDIEYNNLYDANDLLKILKKAIGDNYIK